MFEAPRHIRPVAVGAGDIDIGTASFARTDFGKIAFVIWRGKWTIFATTLAALALAVLFVVIVPHRYTATTEILIDPTDLRALGNDTTQPSPMSDAALMQVESQVQVLSSDAVLRRVVNSENLAHDPEFVRGPSLLARFLGGNGFRAEPTLTALNELKRRVQVKRTERTLVVNVSVTSRDPAKAVRIANAIAQAYLDEQTQVRANAARQVSRSLAGQLQELKDQVRDSEEKIEAYKVRNNMIGANGQLVSDQQLTEMNNQLGVARTRTAEAKARLEQVELVQRTRDENGAFPEALQSPTITALRSQYAEVLRREAEQTATLGALHPAVIDIEAQAGRLKRMIDAEVDRAAVAARTEYASAKASEQTIADNLQTLKHTSIDTSEAMVELRELERDAQASRDIYQAFLVRARETGEQEKLDTKNVRILSKADMPQRRSSPPPSLLLGLTAMMLGAAAGIGLVLLRPAPEAGEQRPMATGTPRKSLMRLWRPAAMSEIPVLATLPAADVSFCLNAADDRTSPIARQMRGVYDEMRARHMASGNPNVLVVGTDDEDDSATVALTFAAVAAATQRVLLIDADLERRTLSALGAEDSPAGLVDVAIGARLLSDVTTLDRDTNINLVSFVSPESRRDRRIYDSDLQRAFEQTRRYDLVIVAAMSFDPSFTFFAGLVDHIVLVARAEGHDTVSFQPLIARLGFDAQKIRGAVLTGAAMT